MSDLVGNPEDQFSRIMAHMYLLFLNLTILYLLDVSLAELFKPLNRISDKSPKEGAVFVCHRHEHVPVIHIRQAR